MNNQSIIWVLAAIIVIGGGIYAVNYLNQPDDRNAVQRLGDAVEEMPNTDAALNQLEDRSPAEKIGDSVEEATDGDGR